MVTLIDIGAVAVAAGLPAWWGRRLCDRGVLAGVCPVFQDANTRRRMVPEADAGKAVEKFKAVAPAVRRTPAAA